MRILIADDETIIRLDLRGSAERPIPIVMLTAAARHEGASADPARARPEAA
jgi:hypothetical protein